MGFITFPSLLQAAGIRVPVTNMRHLEIFLFNFHIMNSRDSAVGKATGYGLNGPRVGVRGRGPTANMSRHIKSHNIIKMYMFK
jgi:hypothetical protein